MSTNGWIKLHRELLRKAIWACATPEQTKVMIAILLMANHEEAQWIWNGQKYNCKPGEMITSQERIADIAGVSRQNVRTAIKFFEKLDFLTSETTSQSTKLIIKNWAEYQGNTNPLNPQFTQASPWIHQPTTTNKKDQKEITKETDKALLSSSFDQFWSKYPRKEAKRAAQEIWARKKLDTQIVDILNAIERAISSEQWKRGFIPHARTWLNQERWLDEAFEPKPMSTQAATQNYCALPGNAIVPSEQRQGGIIKL